MQTYPETPGHWRACAATANHVSDINIEGDFGRGPERRQLHIETLFRAVNDLDIEDFFRGFLFTRHPPAGSPTPTATCSVILCCSAPVRAGRYPEPHDRPDQADSVAYAGIWRRRQRAGDRLGCFHTRFLPEEDARAAAGAALRPAVHPTPSAASPASPTPRTDEGRCEESIRPDYYAHMASQLDAYDRRRMIDNLPGLRPPRPAGAPELRSGDLPRANQRLEPDPGLQVFIGVDAGSNALTPGVTFSQRAYSGQWRKLAEIYIGKGQMNTQQLGDEIVRIMLNSRFGCPEARHRRPALLLDPAAEAQRRVGVHRRRWRCRASRQHRGAAGAVEQAGAPRNSHRRQAVQGRTIARSEPAIIIDPDCVGLLATATRAATTTSRAGGPCRR